MFLCELVKARMQRAVVIDGFNEKDPESSLKLVMKPIPKAEPGQVVVHLTLRPVNPTDLVAIRSGRAARGIVGSATPGSEGFGIVHEVSTIFSILHCSVSTNTVLCFVMN